MSNKDIWFEIDSSVASHIGQRVYYNDRLHGKCLAFVTKAGFERNEAGQIVNNLIVYPPSGSPYPVTNVVLSSDRGVNTFDIAQPGDLTDSGSTPRPEPVAEDVQGETGALPGERPPSNNAPAPTTAPLEGDTGGDTDGDGKLSNREKKRLDKGQ